MVKKLFLGLGLLAATASLPAATYYLAPDGRDANPGSLAAPFFTLNQAVAVAGPGDTIWVRGGTYYYTNTQVINTAGTAAAPIRLLACTNEHPVFNYTNMPFNYTATVENDQNRGIRALTNSSYWYLQGLEICNAGDNGMFLQGSYFTIENCSFHDNGDSGLQMGLGKTDVNPGGLLIASNHIINCDSYQNFDFRTKGGNADGFGCKLHPGPGNIYQGCRSWRNSDDGFDLYETDYAVVISNCWTWHSGDRTVFDALYKAKTGSTMSSWGGNGNGFKMGGNGSLGTHVLMNAVAFNCRFSANATGVDQNSHHDGQLCYNVLSFSNTTYNFFFEDPETAGKPLVFKNCVAFAKNGNATTPAITTFPAGTTDLNNSWDLPVTASPADFVDLSEEAAAAPRQADGSLPNNGFAKLVAGSDLIDKGIDVGVSYAGAAPDLGAYEFGVIAPVQTPAAFDPAGCGATNGGFRLRLTGLTGHGPVILFSSTNLISWTPVCTNAAATGAVSLVDAHVPSQGRRFYRAQEQ
jgi:pectate disaccharide-lyase